MPTRRHILQLLAAAPAVATLAACGEDDLPDPIAAWREPGAGARDPRLYALAHAVLAPNPHNRQPWLVELKGESEIVLYPDLTRLLPATDPFDRQITLGCGAFVELLSLAAAQQGLAVEVTPFPDGEPQPRLDARPFAHVRLKGGGKTDPLFAAIPNRRTNREVYEERAVAPERLTELADAAATPGLRFDWVVDGAGRDALRTLTWTAFDREVHTPNAYQESVHLLRVGSDEIARHRDGIPVTDTMAVMAHSLGFLSVDVLSDPDHWMTKPSIDNLRPLAESAPAFLWMASADNSRATQLASGRAYARLNLAATAAGIAMQPWSQALQEYPEMAEHFAAMKRATGTAENETLQMLVRIGYAPSIPPAPRRGLEEHLKA